MCQMTLEEYGHKIMRTQAEYKHGFYEQWQRGVGQQLSLGRISRYQASSPGLYLCNLLLQCSPLWSFNDGLCVIYQVPVAEYWNNVLCLSSSMCANV